MNPSNEQDRLLLRHTLATVAYRAGKTLRDAPETFANFQIGQLPKTPASILAHMGDITAGRVGLEQAAPRREF